MTQSERAAFIAWCQVQGIADYQVEIVLSNLDHGPGVDAIYQPAGSDVWQIGIRYYSGRYDRVPATQFFAEIERKLQEHG